MLEKKDVCGSNERRDSREINLFQRKDDHENNAITSEDSLCTISRYKDTELVNIKVTHKTGF